MGGWGAYARLPSVSLEEPLKADKNKVTRWISLALQFYQQETANPHPAAGWPLVAIRTSTDFRDSNQAASCSLWEKRANLHAADSLPMD